VSAGAYLLGERFVLWRYTVQCSRDIGAVQNQPIVSALAGWLVAEALAMQGAVEEVTAAVAGENSTRSVGAVSTRSQAHDQQSRFVIAEGRYWFAPILPFQIGTALYPGDVLSMLHEARAGSAVEDPGLKIT
jgi:hypothetical protein